MPKGYRTVSLPDPLYEQMKDYVDSHPEYTSVADFLKELIRKELARLGSAPARLTKEEKKKGE